MHCFLIYDIPHDGTRTKIADLCLDYGLTRLQYSAFVGELNHVHQQELWVKIQRRLGKHDGKICLLTLDKTSWSRRKLLERGGEGKN